eukprot:TRINITY_DN3287_c0_g1_i3.p1 TRINITY_DN3287_c0_g1~~TRINITY_DN3287_c0_g1_i3.p1  ORF type:complete len:121 (-),score=30.90 TRINITY_DN3287_c0_g1_i3:46-408(-)
MLFLSLSLSLSLSRRLLSQFLGRYSPQPALIQEEIYDEVDNMEIQKLLKIVRHFREKVKTKVARRKRLEAAAQQGKLPPPTMVQDVDTGSSYHISESNPSAPLLSEDDGSRSGNVNMNSV